MIAYENDAPVGAVDFANPDEGDAEPMVTRDRWTAPPLYEKCQRRFAVVSGGPDCHLADENFVGFVWVLW
jgi:hypothetical protein